MRPVRPALVSATLLALAAADAAAADNELGRIQAYAVTADHELIGFRADAPENVTSRLALSGLRDGEQILGIDYRVAYGVMYALVSSGRIATVDVASGELHAVGEHVFELALDGERFGFDFNPAADRIRIVSESGQNLRAHPETGALVDANPEQEGMQPDGTLHYAEGDASAGSEPVIAAAAYTYNPDDDKLTTNYAIDLASAQLVRQGSFEGRQPVVSPNTGQLHTVGALGIERLVDAHFDISDVSNVGLAVFSTEAHPRPVLYRLDLDSGMAHVVGVIGEGEALSGFAIAP